MSKLPIIYIAAGHGGTDGGASFEGMREADLNLKVALGARDYLSGYQCTVFMSRTANSPAPNIETRCKDAKDKGANCFISIHHNAGGGVGAEAFFWHTHKASQDLAVLVAKEFKANGRPLRSAKGYAQGTKPSGASGFRSFGVCRINAGNGIPAILGEYAFVDNYTDRKAIDSDANLKKEAEAYGRAVVAFLGLVKNVPVAPPPVTKPKEYTLVADVPGYYTAADAQNNLRKVNTVKKGKYFVFREFGGMVNVTKTDGKAGSWINPKDNKVVVQPAPAPTPPPAKPKAGDKVNLKDKTPLYKSSTATKASKTIGGGYWLYDGSVVNGRYRITNRACRVNKKPTWLYTTGWINKNAI